MARFGCGGARAGGGRPSFRFPEGNKMAVEQLNRRHGRVKLPKLGLGARSGMSRPLDGAGDPLGHRDP